MVIRWDCTLYSSILDEVSHSIGNLWMRQQQQEYWLPVISGYGGGVADVKSVNGFSGILYKVPSHQVLDLFDVDFVVFVLKFNPCLSTKVFPGHNQLCFFKNRFEWKQRVEFVWILLNLTSVRSFNDLFVLISGYVLAVGKSSKFNKVVNRLCTICVLLDFLRFGKYNIGFHDRKSFSNCKLLY